MRYDIFNFMDFNWLWQGAIINLVIKILTSAGVGVLTFFLKIKRPNWSSPLIYSLVAFTLTWVCIVCIETSYKISLEKSSITTTENIQEKVRIWLEDFQIPNQNNLDNNAYFSYIVTFDNGNKMNIARLKTKDHYVVIAARIELEPLINKLPQIQREKLLFQIMSEVAKQRIAFSTKISGEIYLFKRIPIVAELTEDAFIGGIDDMDSAMLIVRMISTEWGKKELP